MGKLNDHMMNDWGTRTVPLGIGGLVEIVMLQPVNLKMCNFLLFSCSLRINGTNAHNIMSNK